MSGQIRPDVSRRYHFGIEGVLNKRGRINTVLSMFTGRPWAVRHITLECTYLYSVMRTWKGDEKRDTIDMLGCRATELPPNAIKGKKHCIEVTFRWGEVFIMQTLPVNGDEAEAENERKAWIEALNAAGRMPTKVDEEVEKLKIHVLSFQHETCVYQYIAFKTANKDSLNEILQTTGAFTSADGQRDSQISTGRTIKSTRLEEDMVKDVDQWIAYLEQAFPLLYRSASERADIEEFHKAELDRTMATHDYEKNNNMASHGDARMEQSRYFVKVITDKVNYAIAKEQRFFEEVQNLVSQFSRR